MSPLGQFLEVAIGPCLAERPRIRMCLHPPVVGSPGDSDRCPFSLNLGQIYQSDLYCPSSSENLDRDFLTESGGSFASGQCPSSDLCTVL